MRWPFSFGRSPAPVESSAPPRPQREWATLPAIQRAVGEPTLTAPTAQFVDSLAGTHDPDLSLEPLGHHVSLDGPAGIVSGLVRPVATYAPSTEMVSPRRPRREAAVQRRVLAPGEAEAELSAAPDGESEVDITPLPATRLITVLDEVVPAHAPLTRLTSPEATAVMHLAPQRPAGEPARDRMAETAALKPATDLALPGPVGAQR